MTLICLWVCLRKLMLSRGCGESHIVREVLLQKMSSHKDNGRDLVWVHMCMCICVYVVSVYVQVINEPGGWVEESVYKKIHSFPPFSCPVSFHLCSFSPAKILCTFSRSPPVSVLSVFLRVIYLSFFTNLFSVCAASGQSSGSKQMSAILFYGTVTSKFSAVWNN